jgi:hypothetical protein
MHNSKQPSSADQHTAAKRCGHKRHVGTCPHCQRAQLARWRSQLIECTAGDGGGERSAISHSEGNRFSRDLT